jgi:hypothetical protein
LICFSCDKISGYATGEQEENFYVVEKTAEVFNEFLKAAKVPVPKNRGEVVVYPRANGRALRPRSCGSPAPSFIDSPHCLPE